MTRRTPRGAAVVALVCASALAAGCSDEGSDPPLDLGASSAAATDEPTTATPDPTATASTEPGEGSIRRDYPDVGLVFTTLPEASGQRRAALQTYVDFERGQRQLSRTGRLNRQVTDNVNDDVLASMQAAVDFLEREDARYAGTAQIEVGIEGFRPPVAQLRLCIDSTELQLVRAGVPGPVEGPVRVPVRVSLTSTGGTWTVTGYDPVEELC